jgi:hypothetical protein
VVKRGSPSTPTVSVGLIAPGVQFGSGMGKPLLLRVAQRCEGGSGIADKGVDARPSMLSWSQTAGRNTSGLGCCAWATLQHELSTRPISAQVVTRDKGSIFATLCSFRLERKSPLVQFDGLSSRQEPMIKFISLSRPEMFMKCSGPAVRPRVA